MASRARQVVLQTDHQGLAQALCGGREARPGSADLLSRGAVPVPEIVEPRAQPIAQFREAGRYPPPRTFGLAVVPNVGHVILHLLDTTCELPTGEQRIGGARSPL